MNKGITDTFDVVLFRAELKDLLTKHKAFISVDWEVEEDSECNLNCGSDAKPWEEYKLGDGCYMDASDL